MFSVVPLTGLSIFVNVGSVNVGSISIFELQIAGFICWWGDEKASGFRMLRRY
jgi:hypothetical protein